MEIGQYFNTNTYALTLTILRVAAEGAVHESVFYNEEPGRSPGRHLRRGPPARGTRLTSTDLTT